MSLLGAVLPGLPASALFSFEKRPVLALPMDRLSYRVTMLLCGLYYRRNRKSSYARLALLLSAAVSYRMRAHFERIVTGSAKPSDAIIRFDPYLPRILDIAAATNLIRVGDAGASFSLTDEGARIVEHAERANLFTRERLFLKTNANLLTDDLVVRLLKGKPR